MTAILTALSSGMSAQKILEYLMRKSPDLAPKITKALASGLSAEKVVKFFSKEKNFEKLKRSMEQDYPMESNANPLVQAQNIRSKNLANDSASGLQRMAGPALGTAAAVGTSYALSRAIPSILQAGTSIPNPQTTPTGNQTGTPSNQLPQLPPISANQPPQNPQLPIDSTMPQSPEILQPEVKSIDATQILSKYPGFITKIQELRNIGNDAIRISGFFQKFNPSQTAKIEKEVGMPIEKIIEDYISKNPILPETKELLGSEYPSQQLDKIKKVEGEPIQKASTVASPQGIGEVKEIRNGKAIIDVDGKLHKVDIEELEAEPEDTIQTVQNLLKIPEVDRSSVVSLFTYDPTDKEMYIQFHNGTTTKYFDVDPEKVFKVANKMGIPVTEGKNIFGAWSPEDKKSLGATLIKEIINDPKYKKSKKGEEPNPNYRNLETLYDYWEKLRKKPKRKRL